MRRIAHLDIADPDVVASPAELGYRTKITFATQGGRLGYHPVNEPSYTYDVHDCLLADVALRRFHAGVRDARRHLPPDGARVVLRLDRHAGLHLIVSGGDGNAWTSGAAMHAELARNGVECVVWWKPEGGQARAVAGADDPWPATVFEQVHPAIAHIVRAAALDAVGDVDGVLAWDLYSGIGETTAALTARGAVVTSVESDVRAVRLAESLGPEGPRRMFGRVEDVAATLPAPAVVITNPPRTGMDARVVAVLSGCGALRIAYISCDAATLARDIASLAPRYRLASLQAFDQFPQTAHMECLAILERR
jgi:tRNA/tmRNA/rRNA uracil-C5-methylase (TrmA/RlmC/RlmD family)